MFSSLKFSTLRARSQNKGQQDDNNNPRNEYDDNDGADADISCASSLRCQQPFTKCNIGKACSKQPTKEKYTNAQKTCTLNKTCPHSQVFPPEAEKFNSINPSMYITCKRIDVFIERDEEGNLGLTLQGGLHQNPEFSRPLFVTYIRPGGPTDKEGTIQVGDRLLAIDGFSLENFTLNEAYNILRNSENPSSKLTIEYDITNMKRYVGPLLIEMESPQPHQLGLTLTNTLHNAAVLIDEIKPASIAERCGALCPGDQILSVNDTRIEGSRIPATEVYKLLRICGGTNSSLLLQILPTPAFVSSQIASKSNIPHYNPKTHVSFDVMYPNNYYEVPNEYIVPTSMLKNQPISNINKTGKTKQMTVKLHSDDRLGYGLSIYSSSKTNAAVISSIISGGPADLCEKLQINDRILLINGLPVTGVTSDPQPLHKVPGISLGAVELLVEYEMYNTFITASDDVLTLELMKYNKKSLGITVTGNSDCMQISDIKDGSVADRCGALAVGDKILSINHQILANCTVQEALNILHSSMDTIILQIEKQYHNHDSSNENIEYTVQLNKQNGPIGITISGSDVSPREIIISALTQGGLAAKTGAFHVGDRVLEIDNHDVSNVLLSDAITLLQKSGDKVLFKVSRNASNSYTDEASNRMYGSPGLRSDDSAVESWESSTQRDVSPNDTIFHHIPQNMARISEGEKSGVEHLNPDVIVPKNKSCSRSEEPVYSNIPYHNAASGSFTLPYCDRIHYNDTFRGLSQNEDARYYMDNLNSIDYNRIRTNVDEIFNITDLNDNESRNSSYEIFQVVLLKDPLYEDFGFSISDGLYERGVFLNRIRQGGPADKIGLLRPFDRIIQVNNVKTEDFDCCLTVPLIAAAGDRITLTVRRKEHNISADSRNQIEVGPWTEKTKEECMEIGS